MVIIVRTSYGNKLMHFNYRLKGRHIPYTTSLTLRNRGQIET